MTAPSLLDELEEVARLSERATPGTWHQDTGGDITRDDGTTLFTREKPDGRSSISFANADYVEAAVNFIRTHHAEIADMAKRLEAAERDSKRLDWLESQREAYGFENCHEGNRWVIDGPFATVRRAIDATQEGDG